MGRGNIVTPKKWDDIIKTCKRSENGHWIHKCHDIIIIKGEWLVDYGKAFSVGEFVEEGIVETTAPSKNCYSIDWLEGVV